MKQNTTSHRNNSKAGRPITTVTQHRLGVFRPVKQLQGEPEDVLVENSWGRCRLPACVLTQVHACVIESIFISALKMNVAQDGAIAILIVIPSVLRNMGKTTRNHTWLNSKMAQLQNQIVEIETKYVKISSRVVRKIFEYKNMEHEDGRVLAIVFESEFSRFLLSDQGIFYPPLLLKIIANLPGPAQAIVRFCWSHAGGVRGETIQAILRDHLKHTWANTRDENKCVKNIIAAAKEIQKTGVTIDASHRVWFEKKYGVGYLKPENFSLEYNRQCPV